MEQNKDSLFVNLRALALIFAPGCGMKLLSEQPIFYPVLNEEYATQIARGWNAKDSGVGYVTRFNNCRSRGDETLIFHAKP